MNENFYFIKFLKVGCCQINYGYVHRHLNYDIWLLILAEVCNAIGDDTYNCCSASKQCDLNQGDCDDDSECSGDLACGSDNCPSPFPTDSDCCEEPGNIC